jgi:Lipase
MFSTWNIASKETSAAFSGSSTYHADVVNSSVCNHMAVISYYTDSIMAKKPILAYACSNYTRFEQGQCTSCHRDHSSSGACQQMGYHASPDSSHGAFYLMTLDSSKPPLFGMLLELG